MAKTSTLAPGQVKHTKTEERIEEAPPQREEKRDVWLLMAGLSDEEWTRHSVYLYRIPESGARADGSYIGCYSKPLTIEEVRKEFGGGWFRIMVVRGSEIQARKDFEIEGAPRRRESGEPAAAAPADMNAQVVAMLRETLERLGGSNPIRDNAAADALDIQKAGFTNALQTQQEMFRSMMEMTKPQPGATSSDPMMELFRPVLVGAMTKLLTPEDPMAKISMVLEMMDKLRGAAPAAGGNGDSIGAIVAHVAPTIVNGLVRISDNWARAAEATAAGRRTAPPSPAGAPPAAAFNPAPAAAPQQPAQQEGTLTMEQMFFAQVNAILCDPGRSVEVAAHDAYEMLRINTPGVIQYLATVGEAGALAALQQIPQLAQACANPKLPAILKEFFAEMREDQEEQRAEAARNAQA